MRRFFSILLAALVVCGFAFVSCKGNGGSTKNSPSAVVEKAMKCAIDKDYEGMVKYFDDGTATEEELKEAAAFISMLYEAVGGVTNCEILGEEISEDGMTATVKTKITSGDGTEKESDATVVKTDKGWTLKF